LVGKLGWLILGSLRTLPDRALRARAWRRIPTPPPDSQAISSQTVDDALQFLRHLQRRRRRQTIASILEQAPRGRLAAGLASLTRIRDVTLVHLRPKRILGVKCSASADALPRTSRIGPRATAAQVGDIDTSPGSIEQGRQNSASCYLRDHLAVSARRAFTRRTPRPTGALDSTVPRFRRSPGC